MSKIDTSAWQKFKIKDLFTIKKVYGRPMSEYQPGNMPYVTGAENDNGIVGYVTATPEAISEGGCISVDPIKGFARWQPVPFVGRGFSGASINLLYNDNLNETTALYVCTAIEKVSTAVAAYTNLFNSDRLAEAEIFLPVIKNDVPDWDYMQERIAELEQARIAELEQYLVATGLNDYTLTDEDIKTLSLSGMGRDKAGNPAVVVEPRKEMRAFRMGDLFEKPALKWSTSRKFNKAIDVSTVCTSEFDLPLCNAKNGDNGIMYYGRSTDFDYVDSGLDIVNDGAVSTGNVYPQPHKIGVLYNAYVVKLKDKTETRELLEYLACVVQKAIKYHFGYDNKATWEKVKDECIQLPIRQNPDGLPAIDGSHKYHPEGYIPDWNYMAAYIKAIEKLVIRDVVDYKDAFIEKAKEAVGV